MNSLQFSVVIPTFNRPYRLRGCLESFKGLEYPQGKWELIVVNDGGAISFSELDEKITDNLPLRLVEKEHAGPAAARNLGAMEARGAYLAFTDDDCKVTSNWLSSFEEGFESDDWVGLGGRTLNPFPGNPTAETMQFFWDYLYSYLRMPNDDAYMLITNNAAFNREVFLSEDGFDESFPIAAAEDRELSHRFIARGFRLGYWPKAKVWHHHQVTGIGYLRLQYRYGRGDYYFRQALKRKEISLLLGQRRRPQFHLELARRLWRKRAKLSLWLLIFGSQIAHQLGSRIERVNRNLTISRSS